MAVSDEKLIAALMVAPTFKQAAAECGITERSIYARLRNKPKFREKYNACRADYLVQALGIMQADMRSALVVVHNIMYDSKVAPTVRLQAANIIIGNCMKLTEQVDIINRLEALEKQNADKEKA